MNIVHLIVVKNSFYILESGRTIQKQLTLEPNLGDQNLVKSGTQHTSLRIQLFLAAIAAL